jgi:tetratricopeptide (TPR) repeat protein
MDCRTWRFAALGLLLGSWGCSNSPSLPVANKDGPINGPMSMVQLPPDAKKEPEGPPRQPKPATCVALADLRMQTALTRTSPAERTRIYDEARRAYQQALKLDPNYLPAYKGLAGLYESIEDHNRAVETLRQAAQTNPRDGEVWYLMGMCHARRKEWQPALEALQKAVELDPENRRYLNDFGLCLARAGRYQDALSVLKRAGGEAQAHYSMARMLEHLGMIEPSLEHLRLAMQLKPEFEPGRQMLERLESSSPNGLVPVSHQVPAETPR